MADFITKFIDYTDGLPTPLIFRQWAAIAAVAGALERRVWLETARSAVYPNLYTLFVAAPGVGKDMAIGPVRRLWQDSRELRVAPVNMSKAGLIDALKDADRKLVLPTEIIEAHCLLVCASEFGVLLPAHDLSFLSDLNYIYDNHKFYVEQKRGIGKPLQVNYPVLNILAGTQPGFMAELFPESAWSMGFFSRLLMIYAASGPQVELFAEATAATELYPELLSDIRGYTKMLGRFNWTQEAKELAEGWRTSGYAPVPEHSKLQHYTARRILHVLKLTLVAAVSARGAAPPYTIEASDFSRARDWLLEAENAMPDIFREMLQKSDKVIIEELHFFCWTLQLKQQAKGETPAIQEMSLVHFLQQRVPSEKVMRILEVAERSGILARHAGTNLWFAKPKHSHGVE